MSERALPDPIQQLDVAVVDQDLLWRVEVMNAVRPLYADDFADVATVGERVHPDDATVLLLGPQLPDTTGRALVELREDRPHVRVVAVAGRVPPEGMPGVDLVVPADTAQEVLVATVADVVGDLRAEQGTSVPVSDEAGGEAELVPAATLIDAARVVVVTSAKGGEGSSLVAANLAVGLAEAPAGRVAVVDTDAVFGDLGIMFDVPLAGSGSGVDLEDLADPGVVARLTSRHEESGVDVVLPPRPADPLAVLTGDALNSLLGAVAVDHDIVIVDAHPSLLADAGLVAIADLVLVVATPRLASLKNAAILVPTLQQLSGGRGEVVEVVLNRGDRGDHDLHQIARAVRAPVVATIPADRGLDDGVDRHVPGVISHPHGSGAKALLRLTGHVIGALGPLAPPPDVDAPDGGVVPQVAR